MTETYQPTGKTTLSPDVLLTIARMAALDVEGVSRLAPIPGGFDRLFRRGADEGIRLKVEDGLVYLDLFIHLKPEVNAREVSRNVQFQIARAMQEMVGLEIGHINIHIEDIDYES